MEDILKSLDGFAGLAALVNGLILWPVVRSLKQGQAELREMVRSMMAKPVRKPRKAR